MLLNKLYCIFTPGLLHNIKAIKLLGLNPLIDSNPITVQLTYLQAHHIDLDFYDHYFKPGAYLSTHKNHIRKWHDNSFSN
jgi:hypothetical protein